MFDKKPKSVETITAKLQSTVAELEAHAEHQLSAAAYQAGVAVEAEKRHVAHRAEYDLARTVAGNIKALLS